MILGGRPLRQRWLSERELKLVRPERLEPFVETFVGLGRALAEGQLRAFGIVGVGCETIAVSAAWLTNAPTFVRAANPFAKVADALAVPRASRTEGVRWASS